MEFINNQVRNVTSRAEAEKILEDMKEIADLYDFATIADLKYTCGIKRDYTDEHFGWTSYDLKHVHILKSTAGHVITFRTPRNVYDSKPVSTRVSYRKYHDPHPILNHKPVYITINTSDLEDLGDTLGSVFEYVSSITNREVHITIN